MIMNLERFFFRLVPNDACQQTNIDGHVCCTNDIFDSFTQSLADELKKLSDGELSLLKDLMSISNKHLERKQRKKHKGNKNSSFFEIFT